MEVLQNGIVRVMMGRNSILTEWVMKGVDEKGRGARVGKYWI